MISTSCQSHDMKIESYRSHCGAPHPWIAQRRARPRDRLMWRDVLRMTSTVAWLYGAAMLVLVQARNRDKWGVHTTDLETEMTGPGPCRNRDKTVRAENQYPFTRAIRDSWCLCRCFGVSAYWPLKDERKITVVVKAYESKIPEQSDTRVILLSCAGKFCLSILPREAVSKYHTLSKHTNWTNIIFNWMP